MFHDFSFVTKQALSMKDKTANFFSLFASTSTLVCCALPAVFVALGAGASFASLLSVFPALIVLSKYKILITIIALLMIGVAGVVNYKTYYMPCPIDPIEGKLCMQTRRRARYLYYISVFIFLFATVFTYLIPRFF